MYCYVETEMLQNKDSTRILWEKTGGLNKLHQYQNQQTLSITELYRYQKASALDQHYTHRHEGFAIGRHC